MKAAILCVGTEILFGQIVNTNAVFLSRELNALGFDVLYHYTVGDNPKRLEETLDHAFKDCDLIVATGGLGPTEDDLTKETIAHYFKDELVVHQESLEALENMAKARGWKMTENNYKQTLMPSKAIVFDNDAGTAPGFALSEGGKTIISMPGPPREMTRMWERRCRPFLESMQDGVIYYKLLRFFGIGESALETKLLDLIDNQTDPTIATYAKEGECSVRVASKRNTLEEAKEAVSGCIKEIREIVGEYIYSEDDTDLNMVLGRLLIDNDISCSVAESCTGGMLAERLVQVPGISKVFDRGLVTYTWKAKMDELGVKEETLKTYGAVSRETALEMAKGLKEKTGSRLVIATTGVAGPDEDEGKPAGLMYIAVILDDIEEVKEVSTGRKDRQQNRNHLTLNAMDTARKLILKSLNK